MRFIKKISLLLVSLLLSGAALGTANAQKLTFEINAPSHVATNEAFKVEYSLNQKPDNFVGPTFDNFDVLAGPTVSTGEFFSSVNGNIVKSSSYTYIYVLIANSAGMHTLPGASVTIGGKSYSSKSIPIEVVDEGAQPSASQPATGADGGGTTAAKPTKASVAADDIVLRAMVDRTTVYKGQPVRVSFKLYTRVQIAGRESVKMPAFNGFWSYDLGVDHYPQNREVYNSKIYDSQIIGEYLLYPQQAGVLTIEPLEVSYVVSIVVESTEQRRPQSILDGFFGGGPEIVQVSKKVATQPITVRINDWPGGAPAGFNGAVGNFTMTSEFSSPTINANSSANYSVRISGSGNLPLIQAPRLEIPTSFEQYNVKTTESLNKTANGISGYRQFEYPLIARSEGVYLIDRTTFTYFNPETASYVTLNTNEQRVEVLPDSTGGATLGGGGLVSGLSKEDLKILGQDIRFIKLGKVNFARKSGVFMGSVSYYAIWLAIIGATVWAYINIRKRERERGDLDLIRRKRANRVALQRLNAAEKHMKTENQRKFYEEMLKALWGYMSDKLNIPTGILTKEVAREEVVKRGATVEQATKYVELISDCEYAQYSPDDSGHMSDIYRAAMESITKFESTLNRK